MKTVQLPHFHPNVICQTDRNDHLSLTRSNQSSFFSLFTNRPDFSKQLRWWDGWRLQIRVTRFDCFLIALPPSRFLLWRPEQQLCNTHNLKKKQLVIWSSPDFPSLTHSVYDPFPQEASVFYQLFPLHNVHYRCFTGTYCFATLMSKLSGLCA